MKTIINDHLNGVNKAETDLITKQLKDHKYARMEISLRHPYRGGPSGIKHMVQYMPGRKDTTEERKQRDKERDSDPMGDLLKVPR